MPYDGGPAGLDTLIDAEQAVAAASKKQTTLPQHRYAIRLIIIFAVIVGDILLIIAAASTAAFLRFGSVSEATSDNFVFVILPAFLLAAGALNCYRLKTLKRPLFSTATTLLAIAIAASLAFTMAFTLQVGANYSRLETGYMLVAAAVYLSFGRLLHISIIARFAWAIEPRVLILGPAFGATDIGANVARVIPPERPNSADPISLEQTYALVRHADRIILAFDNADERTAWAQFVRLIGINAELIEPNLQNITILGVGEWQGAPTLLVARGALSFSERALKRASDIAIALPLLAVVGPWMLMIMLLVKLGSPGPALFVQARVGRNNHPYRCYKLRTMYADMVDPHGNRSTSRDDDRVTRIGKFLRRTSLDEIPQLWNVVRGDMSLVGPRPHALGSTAEGILFWEAVPDYWSRHAIRPGITGLAQVRGLRGETTTLSDIEKRVMADLEYINRWSIWLDLKILLQTIRVAFHRNAF